MATTTTTTNNEHNDTESNTTHDDDDDDSCTTATTTTTTNKEEEEEDKEDATCLLHWTTAAKVSDFLVQRVQKSSNYRRDNNNPPTNDSQQQQQQHPPCCHDDHDTILSMAVQDFLDVTTTTTTTITTTTTTTSHDNATRLTCWEESSSSASLLQHQPLVTSIAGALVVLLSATLDACCVEDESLSSLSSSRIHDDDDDDDNNNDNNDDDDVKNKNPTMQRRQGQFDYWQATVQLTRRAHALSIPLPLPLYERLLAAIPVQQQQQQQYTKSSLSPNDNKNEACFGLVQEWGTHIYRTAGAEALERVLQGAIVHAWIPNKEDGVLSLTLTLHTVQWTLDYGIITYWQDVWAFHVVMALRQRFLCSLAQRLARDDEDEQIQQGATLLRLLEPTLFRLTQVAQRPGMSPSFIDSLRNYPNSVRRAEQHCSSWSSTLEEDEGEACCPSSSSSSDDDDDDDDDELSSDTDNDHDDTIDRLAWELTADLRLGAVSEWVEHWIRVNPTGPDDVAFDPSPPIPTIVEIPIHVLPDGSFKVYPPQQEESSSTTDDAHCKQEVAMDIEHVELPDWEDLYQAALGTKDDQVLELPDLTAQCKSWQRREGSFLRYSPRLERILHGRLFPEG